MIDQLEDLGKKGALSAAKRRREIGRIRDMLEIEPFASRLHMSFTFHEAAAQNLEQDWDANRLPSLRHQPRQRAGGRRPARPADGPAGRGAAEGVDGAGAQRARRPEPDQPVHAPTCSAFCARSPRAAPGCF